MKKIETLRSKILSNLSKLMMVAILAGVLFSCNDDEDDITDVIITFILNSSNQISTLLLPLTENLAIYGATSSL